MKRSRPVMAGTYWRYLISFLIIVSSTVLALALVLYSLFFRNAYGTALSVARSTLSLVSDSISLINDQVFTMQEYLAVADNVVYVLNAPASDKVREFHAISEMRAVKNSCRYLSHVGLYNAKNQYLNTEFLGDDQAEPLLAAIRRSSAGKHMMMVPYTAHDVDIHTRRLLAYVFRYDLSGTAAINSAIVLVVDMAKLEGMLFEHTHHSTSLNVFDSDGRWLLGNQSPDVQDVSYVEDVLHSDQSEGSFTFGEDADRMVVYSKLDAPSWMVTLAQPYDQVHSELAKMRSQIAWFALAILLMGGALSALVSGRLYAPIRTLLSVFAKPPGLHGRDELKLLGEAIKRQAQDVRQFNNATPMFRRNLLMALAENEAYSHDHDTLAWLELDAPWYSLCLFECEGRMDDDTAVELIELIALARFEESTGRCCAAMGAGRYVLLIMWTAPPDPGATMTVLMEMRDECEARLKCEVTLAEGGNTCSISDMASMFSRARRTLRLAYFLGRGRLITDAELTAREHGNPPYPSQLEDALRRAVRRCDQKKVRVAVYRFADYVSHLEYDGAVLYINQLMLSLIKELLQIGVEEGVYRDCLIRSKRLSASDTLDKAAEGLISLAGEVIGAFQSRQSTQLMALTDNVERIIAACYAEPSFSIAMVAEQVGLSPDYLARIYKTQTGHAFAERLAQMRIGYALKLLRETELPIAQISERVGIPNHSHFYALFKKHMGKTPNAYRLDGP